MSSSEADYFNRGHPSVDEIPKKPSNRTGKKPSALQDSSSRDASIDNTNNGKRVEPSADEQSPLLSPAREEDGFMDGQTVLDDFDEFQTTKSIWYLILLTISIGGLQIAWSVELSNGSPYLLSLGLSKSLMALVWIAGPLSGTLVQPYVGMLSDNCRIRWGKRKPFMLGGAAATICSLLFLAWTKEIVGGFLGLFGANPDSDGVKISIIVVAVLWVYILDFAINTGIFSTCFITCLGRL
jgi:solute carrier family 45 protein 1/2/4